MVRFVITITVIIAIWFWIILTWIHIFAQSVNFGGYVYQPYKKLKMTRTLFIFYLYPFCCKYPLEGFEIKLVPAKEAYKRLLVVTLLGAFVTWVSISVERKRLLTSA